MTALATVSFCITHRRSEGTQTQQRAGGSHAWGPRTASGRWCGMQRATGGMEGSALHARRASERSERAPSLFT